MGIELPIGISVTICITYAVLAIGYFIFAIDNGAGTVLAAVISAALSALTAVPLALAVYITVGLLITSVRAVFRLL